MSSAPQPGTVLAGKYRVEQVLGVGGMGAVVAAHHIQLDQRVAIKYLLPEALKNPEVVDRFAREARAAAKIRGEHVARVIDVGQFDGGAPFMIMEYLEGHDLARELATRGPLAVEDVVRYILETCEALAEAHAAKIVHRDLKPQNLFLAKQPGSAPIIKVLDFGISKVGSDAGSAALTRTSALMGTAFYMSPEQLTTPKAVDQRSDIWSLGVIMYELLSGQPPFNGEQIPEIIGAILNNQPTSLRQHRPDVSPALEAVIATCMQSKAAHRFSSVAGLAAALAPFARSTDRLSVDITARVLGEPIAPETVRPSETLASPTIARPPTPAAGIASGPAIPVSFAPTEVPPTRQSPVATTGVATTGGGAAMTAHSLSRSSTDVLPKSKAPQLIAALAGAALVVGGIVAVKTFMGHGEAPRAAGVVSAPASDTPPAASTNALPSLAPDEHAAAAEPTASATAAANPKAAPPAPGRNKAAPAAVVAARPTVSAPPPPAPPPPAPPSATATSTAANGPKNPLNMGLK